MLPSRPRFHTAPELLRKSIDQVETTLSKQIAARPWKSADLRGAQILALDNAAKRAAIDPVDAAIGLDLDRVACMGAALFAALAAGSGAEVAAPAPGSDGVVTTLGAAPDARLGEPIYWRDALLAAMAVRNRRSIRMLAEIPVSLLRALAPNRPDWAFLECEALQALALQQPDAGDRLVDAARAADPATVEAISRDWVLDILSPELQLAFRTIDQDQAGFDKWMEVALKGHHHYYQSRADRQRLILSQLALAPLAMACIAHDAGLHISVVSDYLPRAIIGT